MYMELLEQCQIWNENNEYQKIIDAIEALSAAERTPELDSELARAYNNLAQPGDKELFEKAIEILSPHAEYFQGDHCWNFRMAYAYYYLDQEGPALRYFEQALQARPGDEDTCELIDDCRRRLALPRFEENFRERTEKAWNAFLQIEAELRSIMDEDREHRRGEELIGKCDEALHLAFGNICFEMGFNGQKHELILSPEGDRVKLFELVYFQRHVPAAVLENWNVLVGRQPSRGFGLRSDDWEISGEDVRVWTEKLGDNSAGLTLYCEKLLPLLQKEENRAWWMLATLTDQILGEIPHMRIVDDFDVLESPREEPSILLSQLPEKLAELGFDLSTDPQAYLDSYISYQMQPDEDPEADWRMDVIAGSTCCPPLLNEYFSGESRAMDELHRDGTAAGFLCYPLDSFAGEDRSQKIFDFRDALESALMEKAGENACVLLGGATGIYSGYVDFIAWDLPMVLNAAQEFLKNAELGWAGFHVFRRDVGTVTLVSRESGDQAD